MRQVFFLFFSFLFYFLFLCFVLFCFEVFLQPFLSKQSSLAGPSVQALLEPNDAPLGKRLFFLGGLWVDIVISWRALGGHCYFLEGFGWTLLFLGGLWVDIVISWRALGGHYYFLEGSR